VVARLSPHAAGHQYGGVAAARGVVRGLNESTAR
jgi:hypothetical protein